MSGRSHAKGRLLPDRGSQLTDSDYGALANSWITPEIADQAALRRVDAQEGREVVGHKGQSDCAGISFPYYWPGDIGPVNYRVRRDHPDVVSGIDGAAKQARKYLGAPGSGNHFYIPPGISLADLANISIPIAIVEGEKKALALRRLADHETDELRHIPIAIPGVWSWRGVVGKTGGPNGERLDVRGPIPDFDRVEWACRTVYIIFDANVHTNDSVKAARRGIARHLTARGAKVKFVNLPENCGVNGIDDLLNVWGPSRVLELIDQATDGSRLQVIASPQFESRPDGMYRITQDNDQLSQTPLTNFSASITANILLDDGQEVRSEFEIVAELNGRHFTFTVPAAEFPSMAWPIARMGPTAITYPRQQEYARTAIQCFSMGAREWRIYTHTGWRKVADAWIYLHAGGAIGEAGAIPGIDVRLAGCLGGYNLRLGEPAEVARAAMATLRLARLGPAHIGFSLMAACCRAVFGTADFALHIAGETGAFKSEVAALYQRLFGAGMDRLHLPGAWSSTANALEMVAFQAKDTLLVVDDFAPQGNAGDMQRYHAAADRLFRATGNGAGRARLDSSARLREPKPPRSLILSTGEDIPKGHSLRARLLLLELSKGSISAAELSAFQAQAESGIYENAMSAFIQWLAASHEEKVADFRRRVSERRRVAICEMAHARTPEIIANLQAAFDVYLEFCEACGALGSTERAGFEAECWEALRQAGAAQAKHQAASEPTELFMTLLRSTLSSGRAHLQSSGGGAPESPVMVGWRTGANGYMPLGDCVGWIDGEDIYIDSAAAYRQVQLASRDAGETLPVTEQTLRRRLREKNLLASTDVRRETVTVRRRIGGSARDVLHFRRTMILPDDPQRIDGPEER